MIECVPKMLPRNIFECLGLIKIKSANLGAFQRFLFEKFKPS